MDIVYRDGNLDCVKYLVSQWSNLCPMRLACRNGHLEVVKYIVSQGADVRARDG